MNGTTHREDGPALIEYSRTGKKTSESYYVRGSLHREDGPARISYGPNEEVRIEDYFRQGVQSRDVEPASVFRREDGSVEYVTHLRDGKRHRIDGPAVIEYAEDGSVVNEVYFLHNYSLLGPDELAQRLVKLESSMSGVLEEEYRSSSYAPLLEELGSKRLTEVLAETMPRGVLTVEGIRQVLGGAPVEWVAAWESGS